MTFHSKASLGARHPIHNFEFSNAADRISGNTISGYSIVSGDEGKIGLQIDDNSYWVVMAVSPLTWDVMGPALVTTSERGLMSAADKIKLDTVASGDVYTPVRNESGVTIPLHKLVYVSGWSVSEDLPLVDLADKDDPAKRPCLGLTTAAILNNTNDSVLIIGTLEGIDTSSYALTDQLVLGNSGEFLRPPPDETPFTGEIQNVAQVIRVDAIDGHLRVTVDGLQAVTGNQIFALRGSTGTPSDSNRYVTQEDLGIGPEFLDGSFRIKNTADDTKKLAFDVSAITAATLRQISVPDRDYSLDLPEVSALDIIPTATPPAHKTGRFFYNSTENSFVMFNDIAEVSLNVGEEMWARVTNKTGITAINGKVGYVSAGGAAPEVKLVDARNIDNAVRTLGVFTQDIAVDGQGYMTRFGAVRGVDTSGLVPNKPLYVDPNTLGGLTDVRPSAPDYAIRVGIVLFSDAVDGVIGVDTLAFNGTDASVNIEGELNGIITQKPGVSFIVDTGVIYAEVVNEQIPTRTLPVIFDGIRYNLDTLTGSGTGGAARVALISGADANSPQTNFLILRETLGVITLEIETDVPTGDFAWVGIVEALDATTTAADGIFNWQRFNNAVDNGSGNGYNNYMSERLRREGAKYVKGVDPTVTIDTVPSPDSVKVSTTSGQVTQLHMQVFDVQDGNTYYVVNHPTEPWKKITDLNEIDVIADGASIANNDRVGLNIFGTQNSSGGVDKLLVTLPNGVYGNDGQAINDFNNFAITTMPSEKGQRLTAFRICRVVLKYTTAGGGTWENVIGVGEFQDERGFPLGQGGGGGGSGSAVTDFSDADFSIFNSADPTKTFDFDASQITTATNRTYVAPDADGTLALLSDITPEALHYDPALTGLYDGGRLTQNGTTQVDVTAGSGQIVNFYTDYKNPIFTPVSWGAQTITIPNLGTDEQTHIYVDNTGTIQTQSTPIIPGDERVKIFLGFTVNDTGVSQIADVFEAPVVVGGTAHAFQDYMGFVGATSRGGTVTQTGDTVTNGDMALAVEAHTLFFPSVNWHVSKANPNQKLYSAADPVTWTYMLQTGENVSASNTLVDPTNYDNSGTLTLVPTAGAGRRTTIQYLYQLINGSYIMMYGQNVYEDLPTAKAALDDDAKSLSLPSFVRNYGTVFAAILVTQNCTDLADPLTADIVQVESGSLGGGGGAQNEYSDAVFRILDDVDQTKKIAFQASGITTETVRTISMPDKDVTLDDASDPRDPNAHGVSAHTGAIGTASQISDFDTEVANNAAVAANTAKVSNATHTSEVTGATALTVQPSSITGKPSTTVASGDLVAVADISDSNALKQVTAQSIADLGGGGTTIGFEAYRTATQSLSSGVETLVQFNTVANNEGSDFSTSTYKFTAAVNEWYTLAASLRVTLSAAGYVAIRLYKNTTLVAEDEGYLNAAGNISVSLAKVAKPAVNDTFEVRVFQVSGFAATIQATASDFSGSNCK
jgi:hypothetical protein